jgi:dCMP deaminase
MKTPEQIMEYACSYGRMYSDDPDTKVGCGVQLKDGRDCYGCNELPNRLNTVDSNAPAYVPPTRLCRPEKYKWIQHAELNVICWCAKQGISLCDATMYLPWFPCATCAQAIISSGITKLVCYKPDMTNPKWADDFRVSLTMLTEACVDIQYVEPV